LKQDVYEFKEAFKEKLLSYGVLKRTNGCWYRFKECPKCGDKKWHCYIKIDSNDDGPMGYNCFKCNSHGAVTREFIEAMGYINLNDMTLPKFIGGRRLNIGETISTKIPDMTVSDSDNIEMICEYVHSRVGRYPTLQELQAFHFVGNPRKYVTDYLGIDNIETVRNRYWFQMTNGNIIGRYKNDNTDMRWIKYKTTKCRNVGLYRISVPVDLYQPINIIISEGVMDSIGLYYNYAGCENNLYVSVMGKQYTKGLQYAIDRGIFGDSVSVRIMKDSDVPMDQMYIDWRMKSLFKKIEIYENHAAKDYGVTPELFDVHKVIDRRR
jgi:hypothetical protein